MAKLIFSQQKFVLHCKRKNGGQLSALDVVCIGDWVEKCDGKEVIIDEDGDYICGEYVVIKEWCEEV